MSYSGGGGGSGSGGGSGKQEYPSLGTPPSGSIRFNTDRSKLEIYNGETWWDIDATSPEEQTGGTRGVIMGGLADGEPAGHNVMQFITVSSTGDSADFGDLTRKKYASYGGISSRTRGIMPGGYFYNQPSGPGTYIDDMDGITISILGNAFDFGNLSQGNRAEPGSASNETRGIIFGGSAGPSPVVRTNNITYVTIASSSNSIDFGDMIGGLYQNPTGTASPTRLVMGTGEGSPANFSTLEYITISTLGNASNFGDATIAASYRTACGNAVRGLIAGGYSPNSDNIIELITIATQGDAVDFGDLTNVRGGTTSMASPVRGVFAGGRTPTEVNTIDYVQIPSAGNAIDFGDLLSTVSNACSVSNGHGGLAG